MATESDMIKECPMEIEESAPVHTKKPVAAVVQEKNNKPQLDSVQKTEILTPKSKISKRSLPTSEKKSKKKKPKRKVSKKKTVTKTTKKTIKKVITKKTFSRRITKENKFRIRGLNFRAWKDDQDVIDIFTNNGWTYLGEPIDEGREDYPNSMYEGLEDGRIADEPCLYWADDDDSKALAGFSPQHLISSIPNADKALTKVFQQKMFQDYNWFPKCFTLPKERELINQYLVENPESYWIAKPRDSYGGFGMCVFKNGTEEFNHVLNRKCTFALQRYMANPYLFGGFYKFHLRCYMVISNVKDPYRAYLWKNAQIQFATHHFDLTQIDKSFNKYSHITNYKVNNEKKNNKFVCQDKPGIGPGTEWSLKKFFEAMSSEPKFSEDKFWQELETIAKVVGEKLSTSSHVRRGLKQLKYNPQNHFEIYGLDIIMDEDCNLALTEANTQPGLDMTNTTMPNGEFNPEIIEANKVTEGIVCDTINLLGIARKTSKKFFSPWVPLFDESESMDH